MSSQIYHPADLDGPGYEYLRSHQAMSFLYRKLVALNYQKEFCPLYKCPPINKYYFAVQSPNKMEQQFSFMSLSVWLIKDKCQMNFDIDVRDNQDLESTMQVIIDATRLLLSSNDEPVDLKNIFHVGRLRQGYGAEVIFCLNKFADRALEMISEFNPGPKQVDITFHNKSKGVRNQSDKSDHISIGQSLFVDTSKSYDIDLILDPQETILKEESSDGLLSAWNEDKLNKIATALQDDYEDKINIENIDWSYHLNAIKSVRKNVEAFKTESVPLMESISILIERQLNTIEARETSLQNKLKVQIESYLKAHHKYSSQRERNNQLVKQIEDKSALLERHRKHLRDINIIDSNLNYDKIRQLEQSIKNLKLKSQMMENEMGRLAQKRN